MVDSLGYSEWLEKVGKDLIREQGYSGLLRYIRNFEEDHGENYLKVQDKIYKDMSLDEIFEKASSNWQDKNQKLL